MSTTIERFNKGDRVTAPGSVFSDGRVCGTVIRVNQKTVSVQPDADERHKVGVNEGGWVNVYPEHLEPAG